MRSVLFLLLLFLLTACSNSLSTEEDPPTTQISFALPEDSHVKLWVENSYQTKIITLVNDSLQMGSYRALWNGVDSEGKPVPYGLYSYHLKVGDELFSRALIYSPPSR